jgi:hypothetical protein
MAVSIAMSAQKRGWSQQDYINEIVRHESRLWHQLCTGKKGRARSEGSSYKSLDKAWEEARLHLADAGERTRDDIKADAIELAFMWTDRLVDNVDNLTANEIAVMQYVICQTEERGMFKVTCPVREVGKFAKVSIKTASRILGALTDKGMLNRYSRGTHSANGTGKASIYGLMDFMMWESRQAPVASGLPLGEYEVDESAGFAPPGPPAYPIDNISTNNPILPIDLDPTDTTRHPEGEAGGQTEESEGEESENLTTGCQPPSVTHRHGGILPYVSFSSEVPVDHVADLTTSVVPAPNFLCLTQS